jgi:hypothetical protein
METKRFTQFGTFSVISLSSLLVFFIYLTWNVGLNSMPDFIIFGILSIVMLISILTFYQLVIEIDRVHISFKLGIGLFSRQYKIDNLNNCKSVTNSVFNGIGIRMISDGWLYNVTGTKAIELTFKDSKKIIRIGTNKPDEISEIVAGFIKKSEKPVDYTADSYSKSGKNLNIIIIGVLLFIYILFTLYENMETKITLSNNNIEIGGMYGRQIHYSDIAEIDTLTWIPNIEFKSNGYSSTSVCKGHFRIKGIGEAMVFADCSVTPMIKLTLKNKEVYFFNFNKRQSTIDLYVNLKTKITK